ncbi:phage related helicase [Streptomyces sp. OM5714]|nr:phage related helicase [Streptomyces sp. OM5714]
MRQAQIRQQVTHPPSDTGKPTSVPPLPQAADTSDTATRTGTHPAPTPPPPTTTRAQSATTTPAHSTIRSKIPDNPHRRALTQHSPPNPSNPYSHSNPYSTAPSFTTPQQANTFTPYAGMDETDKFLNDHYDSSGTTYRPTNPLTHPASAYAPPTPHAQPSTQTRHARYTTAPTHHQAQPRPRGR